MVEHALFADATTMTTAATTPPPEPPVQKRLTRSSSDHVIAGVAGGFGRYLGGAGVILYGAAWLLVPTDDQDGAGFDGRGVARRTGIALGVLVLTLVAAASGFWGIAFGGGRAVAIVVIAVGAALVAGAFTGGARWLILPAIALAMAGGV